MKYYRNKKVCTWIILFLLALSAFYVWAVFNTPENPTISVSFSKDANVPPTIIFLVNMFAMLISAFMIIFSAGVLYFDVLKKKPILEVAPTGLTIRRLFLKTEFIPTETINEISLHNTRYLFWRFQRLDIMVGPKRHIMNATSLDHPTTQLTDTLELHLGKKVHQPSLRDN